MTSTIKVDTIQDQDGNNIINENANTVTVGKSGDTVNIVGTLQNNGAAIPGDISSVVAGTGLSGGGTTGAVTLNIEAAQPTVTSTGTLAGFTSTGIDDNATSTAITIDSSERVGIGITSPLDQLSVLSSGIGKVRFAPASGSVSNLLLSTPQTGDCGLQFDGNQLNMFSYGDIAFFPSTSNISGSYPNSEKMRIKNNGNVGIGTTSPTYPLQVYTTTSGNILSLGGARSLDITNSDNGAYVGAIWDRDINSAGGIHTWSIEANEKMRILPTGGITFNGDTAQANALDDYEEGTWTPTYVPDSGAFTSVTYASTVGDYTKIGNTVYFTFYIQTNAITVGSASGAITIGGLPFAPGGGAVSNGGGTVINASFFAGDKPFYGTAGGSSEIFLFYSTGSTSNDIQLNVTDLGTGGTDNVFQMMGTYLTNS